MVRNPFAHSSILIPDPITKKNRRLRPRGLRGGRSRAQFNPASLRHHARGCPPWHRFVWITLERIFARSKSHRPRGPVLFLAVPMGRTEDACAQSIGAD